MQGPYTIIWNMVIFKETSLGSKIYFEEILWPILQTDTDCDYDMEK